MGIIWVREHWTGRVGPWRYDGVRSYARIFKVLTNSPLVGPMEVIFATDAVTGRKVSQLGDPYVSYQESDYGAICTDVRPTPEGDSRVLWEVVCDFKSPDPTDRGGGGSLAPHKIARDPFTHSDPTAAGNTRGSATELNPFMQAPSVDWKGVKGQVFKSYDINGDAIANTAKIPIEGGMPVDVTYRQLTIVRNEPAFDEAAMGAYHDRINLEPFMGRSAAEVKCETIDGTLVQQAQYVFWRVTYNFLAALIPEVAEAFDGWDWRPINAGYDELVSSVAVPIMKKGHAVAVPWPLTSAGVALADGSTAYHYLRFERYHYKSFIPLNLPFQWM